MKKTRFFAIALALLMLLQAAPTAALAVDGGNGDDADPVTHDGKVYVADTEDEELDEDDPSLYDSGTYTRADMDSADEYLTKQFDWSNAGKSEGVITFKTKLNVDSLNDQTALYAFTPCCGHGFTKDIAKRNLEYLLDAYDRVDVITVTGERQENSDDRPFSTYITTYSDIHIVENVGQDTDEDGKADYLNLLDGDYTGDGWGGFQGIPTTNWDYAGNHFMRSLYTGLYAYLAGMDDAMALESNPAQTLTVPVRDPAAIYVSFDGILGSGAIALTPDLKHNWLITLGVPYEWDGTCTNHSLTYPDIQYDCWGLLYDYRMNKKYFSVGLDSTGRFKEPGFWYSPMEEGDGINSVTDGSLHYRMWNEIIAMANPSLLGEMDEITIDGIPNDTLWHGETRTLYDAATGTGYLVKYGMQNYFLRDNQDYYFDYAYDSTFAEVGVPVKGITLTDKLSNYFKISEGAQIEWEADPADGAEVRYTINEETSIVTFNIDEYKAGTELTIRIHVAVDTEAGGVNRWVDTNESAELTVDLGDGKEKEYKITSPKAHLERRDIAVTKTWSDAGENAYRPDSITFRLYADGAEVDSRTVTATDGWSCMFQAVPIYDENGNEITYTVEEDTLTGYNTTVTETADGVWEVTNETIRRDITVTKIWNDDGESNYRPESVTFRLYANDEEVDHCTVTAGDKWICVFEDLPVYRNGEEITYTVEEDTMTGYNTTVTETADGVWEVTNETIRCSITVAKTWDDDNNRDGDRPQSITIHLMDGTTEVASQVVSEADGWEWTFENRPVYRDGVEIVYTLIEDSVAGYEAEINGFDVTNTHEIETITIEGTKTWDDDNNRDGVRPQSITIHLMDGTTEVASQTVTEEDEWKWSFTDLPKYDDGEEIEYTITEEAVNAYTTTINGFDVTNTHEIAKRSIEVTKVWEGNGRNRPNHVTIRLYADGEELEHVEIGAQDDWTYVFEDLYVYNNGEEIVYTITEDKVEGYETTFEETEPGVWVVTNTKETEPFVDPTNPVDPDPRPELNTKDHYAYIIGYPDGTVQPNGTITRAETVTIFFRMLTDESRDAVWSTANSFTDVQEADWFNNAISTMENGGIINGYPDGSFKPNGKITRAEFAAMAIRFFQDAKVGPSKFSDTIGHWAEEAINMALEQGLITGYPDGTFRPDQPITRAEAMTIVNRVLKRAPHKDHLLPEWEMIVWPDNMDKTVWYYADVQEATNSHEYTMSGAYENWERELPVRDWAAFEKMWSNAHSAANPGEVVGN